jgi:hypothetical protein
MLEYFDINRLGSYVMDAWQKQLVTEEDPTSSKYLVVGPKKQNAYTTGLLGGLKEEIVEDLVFDGSQVKPNIKKDDVATDVTDNELDHAVKSTLKLAYKITNSTTARHSKTHSIKTGISEKLTFGKGANKMSAFVGLSETTFSFEYSYSWTDEEANTHTVQKDYDASTDVDVPAGKVYRAVIMADHEKAMIPYSAQIRLTGTSETNFPEEVQDPATKEKKKDHSADAGQVCSWIKKHKSAGWIKDALGNVNEDPTSFEQDPDERYPERGIVSLRGTMDVDQSVNFVKVIMDITDTYRTDPDSKALIAQLKRGETLPPKVATKVEPVGPEAEVKD